MPTAVAPPLVFEPLPVARPWGGQRVAAWLRWPEPDGGPFGEWWLLSARSGKSTRVCDGPLAGATLRELLERDAAALLGAEARATTRFPLLLKLLDTAQPLSLQIHPSESAAPGEGKTESWYVVEADPGATLWLGLRPGASAADVVAQARAGRSPEPLLARHAARRGLLAHLPPGTIHALGAGIVAIEFQTSADTTWRIWDWGRAPARTLHLDQAQRDAAPDQSPHLLTAEPDATRSPPCDRLVDCDAYRVERLQLSGPVHLATGGRRCEVLLCLDAPLRVRGEAGVAEAPRGHAVLVPAGTGDYVVTADPAGELLRALPALREGAPS